MNQETKNKLHWWTPNDILGYNCIFNLVESSRGMGKSYGMIKFFINRFKKYKEQWAYLRRYQEDIDFVRFNLFTNLELDGVIKFAQCRIYGNRIIFNEKGLDKEEFEKEYEKLSTKAKKGSSKAVITRIQKRNQELRDQLMDQKIDKKYDSNMGITFPINNAGRVKSSGLSTITWAVFDEYLEEFGQYLPNEVERLMSIYESVDRSKDTFRMFFLGNRNSDINPYYEYFNVLPEEDSKFTHIKKLSLAIQRFNSPSVASMKASTRFGKAMQDLEYGKYLRSEGSRDDRSLIVKLETKYLNYFSNIITNKGTYGIYTFGSRLYIGRMRKNQQVYNLTKTYKDGIPNIKGTELETILKDKVNSGDVLFYSLSSYTGLKEWYTP